MHTWCAPTGWRKRHGAAQAPSRGGEPPLIPRIRALRIMSGARAFGVVDFSAFWGWKSSSIQVAIWGAYSDPLSGVCAKRRRKSTTNCEGRSPSAGRGVRRPQPGSGSVADSHCAGWPDDARGVPRPAREVPQGNVADCVFRGLRALREGDRRVGTPPLHHGGMPAHHCCFKCSVSCAYVLAYRANPLGPCAFALSTRK